MASKGCIHPAIHPSSHSFIHQHSIPSSPALLGHNHQKISSHPDQTPFLLLSSTSSLLVSSHFWTKRNIIWCIEPTLLKTDFFPSSLIHSLPGSYSRSTALQNGINNPGLDSKPILSLDHVVMLELTDIHWDNRRRLLYLLVSPRFYDDLHERDLL